MIRFFQIIFGGIIFNFIGASIRWIYGSVWRTLFNKPKFTFKEYLYGPKGTNDYYDKNAHELNNKLIGIFAIGIAGAIIVAKSL
ncbi:hypothetical protein [Croceitalea rosinachiae]|uniref:Uncharacterized protein n=1 Tax=Croceitalea rosinachiae TaxID=3075596 RepID=A0ABU3ACZ8_9FLAO|nr:hypothetical protein [Croceitalea sp. F388]MDT0608051.1 hypothetical protein [Croceitalea sp. F388]